MHSRACWRFAPATAAQAAVETTTINFDSLSALTRITDQYPGILFASPVEFGFKTGELADGRVAPSACGPPFARETLATHSPPKEAGLNCGGSEFPEAGTFAVISNFAKKVSAFVGDPGQPSDISDVFRLDAYDVERNLIGSAEATALTAEVNTPISFEAPSYEIAYFTIYRANPLESESFLVGIGRPLVHERRSAAGDQPLLYRRRPAPGC